MSIYFVVAVAAILGAALSVGLSRQFAVERVRRTRLALDERRVQRLSTPLDLVVLVLLVAFAAMRAVSVGTDTIAYFDIFQYTLPTGSGWAEIAASTQEVGYALLSLAVKHMGGGFTELLWVTSTITMVAAYWAMKRISKNFTVSLALFIFLAVYLLQFNAIRQGLSVSLLFLGATFLTRKRGWIAYVILCLLAISFHSSAIIPAIMLPIFARWKVTLRGIIAMSSVVIALTALLWASPWLLSVVESLNPRYALYLDWHIEAGLGLYLMLAVQVALVLYAVYLKPSEDDMRYAAWSAVGLAWLIIGTQSVVASRVGSYFLVFLCVLLPNVMKDRKVPVMHTVGLLAAAAIYFGFYVSSYSALVPYSFS